MCEEIRSPLRNPAWLFLTLTLPAILLLLLWGKDLFIVWEAMAGRNWKALVPVLSLIAFYGIGGTVTAAILQAKKRDYGAVTAVILLAIDVLIMILFAADFPAMRPDVENFILPVERWGIYLFTFQMPSAAHAIMILADRFRGTKVTFYAFWSVIIIPFAIFLLAHLLSLVSRRGLYTGNFFYIFFFALLVVFGVIFILCVTRCMLYVIPKILERFPNRYLLPLIIGVILPVCGLILNIYIPFPCDLRSPVPYICTLLNALILSLPLANRRNTDFLIIFLKGAAYWFPLYFFLLFLPWLPLFVPAMIAFGAGFLILTPTLLFLLQNYFYLLDYRKLTLPKKQIAAAFFAGVLTVPVIFFVKAYSDKTDLEEMVRVYYNLPYQMTLEEQAEQVDLDRLSVTLERMISARNGVELPFLGELYNAIVYKGLVVSDSQVYRMYSDLFGTPPPKQSVFGGGRDRYRPRPLSGLSGRKSTVNCKIASVKSTVSSEGAGMEIRITGSFQGEYAGTMKLPEGVFVSGLSLEINGKLERGSIAERKSALWIYEKITEAKRDPSLIYYTGANDLRFFVFPVDKKGRRVVVDFLYPAGTSPEIELDGVKYKLPARNGSSNVKLLSREDLSGKIVKRSPEIILICDRSCINDWSSASVTIRQQLLSLFPEAKTMRIVSGLIAADEPGKAYPVSETEKALAEFAEKYKTGTPGFAVSNVIKGAILGSANMSKEHYPVFVLWSTRPLYRGWDLHGFEAYSPEYPVLTHLSAHTARAYHFSDLSAVEPGGKPAPAAKLDDGRIVRVDAGAAVGTGTGKYLEAQKLRADSLKLLRNPSLEKELWVSLVRRSIDHGVLIPQTSWIVLETEAQRKTLIEMQEKKLSAASALDIENTGVMIKADAPDTALIILAVILLVFGIFRNRPWLQQVFRKVRNG